MLKDRLNLNGEFLGISALAVYSAPWFLQIILLLLVVSLFLYKVAKDSKQLKKLSASQNHDEIDEFDQLLLEANKMFFGFTVPIKNQTTYWIGFLIYFITLGYAIYNTILHIFF